MEKKKYTAKYFRESIPEWKRKKDPLIARLFYRRVSFYLSSYCADRGVSANSVSYFSIIIALLSCACYFIDNHNIHIIGAVLINLWLVLDCVDGNLARSVKKQPFGEFADASSSYFLISFVYICMGYAVYNDGGLLFNQYDVKIVLLAVFATASDAFMRLLYNKFNQGKRDYYKFFLKQETDEEDHKDRYPSRLEQLYEALSIGGYFPLIIMLLTFLYSLDLFVVYLFISNILICIIISTKCIISAIRMTEEYEKNIEKDNV